MKQFNLSKIVGAGVLTLSMAIVPLTLPASAQTNTAPSTTTPSTTTDTTGTTVPGDRVGDERYNNGFDWGWLGLIGLVGLAGLAGRKRAEPTAYRDPNTVSSTGYRE